MTILKRKAVEGNLLNIPADEKLPGLSLLFDMHQVKRTLESNLRDLSMEITECQGVYVRYKLGTNCIVTYTAKILNNATGKSCEIWLYGKSFTAEDFEVAVEKVNTRHSIENDFLNPVIAVPQDNLIFYVFPNDSELRGLPTVCDSRKISRILYDIENLFPRSAWRISDKRLKITVIRYKPEKRAVVKIESRAVNRTDHAKKALTVYLRTYSDNRGKTIYRTMRELHLTLLSHPELKIPRALAYIDEKRFLLTEGMAGTPLLELLQLPQKREAIIKTAGALAALHQITNIKIAPKHSEDLMAEARATGETLKQIVPELTDVIRLIQNRLEGLNTKSSGESTGFVHGDFHCGQILIDNKSIVMLDFDRSFAGGTLCDVGNFCAHLYIIGQKNRWTDTQEILETFVTHYEMVVHKTIDRGRLNLWTAYGLFLFSVYPFRSLESDWKSSVASTIRQCETILS